MEINIIAGVKQAWTFFTNEAAEDGNAVEGESDGNARSLSDLGYICCKSVWTVHISPLYWVIEQLLPCKIDKI